MNFQPDAHQKLSLILQKGTVPHALLFTGIEGVGKRTTAMRFAKACNCLKLSDIMAQQEEQESGSDILDTVTSCDCRSCRKIESGNHPDIHKVEPTGAFIKIDQIRELCYTLGMKPYEARMRVTIIANAQMMNPEASNALLKMLEEPPAKTVLILTATQASELLPTILSRCQHLRFPPIPRGELERFLIETQAFEPQDAMILATLANGSLTKISSKSVSVNHMNWIRRRDWLISTLERLILSDTIRTEKIGLTLSIAERLSKNKEMLQDSLEMMKGWLRDLIICKLMCQFNREYPEKLMNRDVSEQIYQISQHISIEHLLAKVKAIQTAQRHFRSNTNLRLTLEVMMMQLAK